MAPRHSRPSASASHQLTPLPTYEPPAYALNLTGQRALNALSQTHSLTKLKRHLETASTEFTEMAGEINDRLIKRQEIQEQRRARRSKDREDVREDNEREVNQERAVKQMKQKVAKLTSEMEIGMRRIIDTHVALEGVEGTLKEIAGNVASFGTQSSSTFGRSQQPSTARSRGQVSNDEEDENSEFDVTRPGADGPDKEIPAPSRLLSQKLAEQQAHYQSLSLSSRYATNNDYIGFKRVVHDSQHPGDDTPPMPHASTWFPSSTSDPSSSNTNPTTMRKTRHLPTSNENDESDDLAIASERISTKCPITLQNFKEPVTSKKCPHSFEKSAILSLINDSGMRREGHRGEKAVKCPVCEMLLSASDLAIDKVLTRRIKRLLAAQQEADSDAEEASSSPNARQPSRRKNGVEEIDSESGEDIDRLESRVKVKRSKSMAPRIKAEKGRQEQGRGAGLAFDPIVSTQVPSASQVVDLEGAEEE